jgi:hypothetical protein
MPMVMLELTEGVDLSWKSQGARAFQMEQRELTSYICLFLSGNARVVWKAKVDHFADNSETPSFICTPSNIHRYYAFQHTQSPPFANLAIFSLRARVRARCLIGEFPEQISQMINRCSHQSYHSLKRRLVWCHWVAAAGHEHLCSAKALCHALTICLIKCLL